MKRKIRTIAVLLCAVLAVSVMCGCGDEEENVSADVNIEEEEDGLGDLITDEDEFADFEEEIADGSDLADETEADAESEEESDGYAVYADKIEELKSKGLADQFTLAYINDDPGSEYPELIASDSTGSFDHENAFIFTVNNGQVVEVASVIAGVDGGNLDYAIGANIVHISGGAAGMREVFSRIENGKLEEVFVAEATSADENAEYSVNGDSVSEQEYYEHISAFVEPYNPLVRIAYDGLYEVEYKVDNGYGGFEVGSADKYDLTN